MPAINNKLVKVVLIRYSTNLHTTNNWFYSLITICANRPRKTLLKDYFTILIQEFKKRFHYYIKWNIIHVYVYIIVTNLHPEKCNVCHNWIITMILVRIITLIFVAPTLCLLLSCYPLCMIVVNMLTCIWLFSSSMSWSSHVMLVVNLYHVYATDIGSSTHTSRV